MKGFKNRNLFCLGEAETHTRNTALLLQHGHPVCAHSRRILGWEVYDELQRLAEYHAHEGENLVVYDVGSGSGGFNRVRSSFEQGYMHTVAHYHCCAPVLSSHDVQRECKFDPNRDPGLTRCDCRLQDCQHVLPQAIGTRRAFVFEHSLYYFLTENGWDLPLLPGDYVLIVAHEYDGTAGVIPIACPEYEWFKQDKHVAMLPLHPGGSSYFHRDITPYLQDRRVPFHNQGDQVLVFEQRHTAVDHHGNSVAAYYFGKVFDPFEDGRYVDVQSIMAEVHPRRQETVVHKENECLSTARMLATRLPVDRDVVQIMNAVQTHTNAIFSKHPDVSFDTAADALQIAFSEQLRALKGAVDGAHALVAQRSRIIRDAEFASRESGLRMSIYREPVVGYLVDRIPPLRWTLTTYRRMCVWWLARQRSAMALPLPGRAF